VDTGCSSEGEERLDGMFGCERDDRPEVQRCKEPDLRHRVSRVEGRVASG